MALAAHRVLHSIFHDADHLHLLKFAKSLVPDPISQADHDGLYFNDVGLHSEHNFTQSKQCHAPAVGLPMQPTDRHHCCVLLRHLGDLLRTHVACQKGLHSLLRLSTTADE